MAGNVLGSAIFELVTDDSKFTQGIDKAEGKAKASSTSIGSAFEGIGKKATLGFAGAGVAVAAFAKDSFDAFAEFDTGMREVFTLLPGISGDAMSQMSSQVQDFANEFGTLPNQVIPSLYTALSAGIPAGNVFDYLEVAQKAAIAGASDLETAVNGLSSVVNAYGSDVLSVGDASDTMFTGIRLGKLTMDELSSSLSNVVPVAASLHVSFSDVTAALATMTAQGTPAAQATTQLRQALIEVSDSGTQVGKVFQEISGQTFQQFIDSGHNLNDVFALLSDYSQRTGVDLGHLFGSVEAGQAVLQLTGKGAQIFANNINEMGKRAGATDTAYQQMDAGIQRSLDRIKANFETLQIRLAEKLAPAIDDVTKKLVDNAPQIADSILTAADAMTKLADAATTVDKMLGGRGFSLLLGAGAGAKAGSAAGPLGAAAGALAGGSIMVLLQDGPEAIKILDRDLTSFLEKWGKLLGVEDQAVVKGKGVVAVTKDQELAFGITKEKADEFADVIRDLGGVQQKQADAKHFTWLNDVNDSFERGKAATEEYRADLNAVADAFDRAQEAALRSQYSVLNWNKAQGFFDQQMQDSQGAVSGWEQKLQGAQQALDFLNEKQKTSSGLTAEEKQQRQLLTEAVARYSGGIKNDLMPNVVAAQIAAYQFTATQDDLNKKLKSGEINQTQYNEAMTAATSAVDPVTAAALGLATAQGGVAKSIEEVVKRVEGLLVKLGLIPAEKKTEVTADIAPAEASIVHLDEVPLPAKELEVKANTVPVEESLGRIGSWATPAKTVEVNANPDPFDQAAGTVDGRTFDPKTVTVEGNPDPFDQAAGIVDARQFDPKTTEINANPDPFDQAAGQVEGYTFTDKTVTALGDVGDALGDLASVTGAVNQIPRSFTITAHVDTGQADAAIAHLDAQIPHSPAKEGPLSVPPNWDWVFEGVSKAAAQHTDEALKHIKDFADTSKAVIDTLRSAFDFSKTLSGADLASVGNVDAGWFSTLSDFSENAINQVADLRDRWDKDGLDAIKGVSDAMKSGLETLKSAFDLASTIGKSTLPDGEMVHKAIGQLAWWGEHTLISLGDLADKIDPEMPPLAKEVAAALKDSFEALKTGFEFASAIGESTVPSGELIHRWIGQLAWWGEHATQSLGDLGAKLGSEMVAAAKETAAAVKDSFAALESGYSFATAIAKDVLPSGEAIHRAIGQLSWWSEHAAQSLGDLAVKVGPDMLQSARDAGASIKATFDALGGALSFVQDAAAYMAGELSISDDQLTQVETQLTGLIRDLAVMFDHAASELGAGVIASASKFADAAKPVVDVAKPGLDVIKAVADLVATPVSNDDLGRLEEQLVGLIRDLAYTFDQAATALGTDVVDSAAKFADSAKPVLDAAKPALDVIKSVGEIVKDGDVQQVPDLFYVTVSNLIARLAQSFDAVATQLGETTLENARKFADAAKPIFDLVRPALDAFKALPEFGQSAALNLDTFQSAVEAMVNRLANLSTLSDGGVVDASTFASNMEAIAASLQAGAAAIGGSASGWQSSTSPGPVNAFASGGWITEPVVGMGVRSGQSYSFAESQAEYVTPGNQMGGMGEGAGAIVRQPICFSLDGSEKRVLGEFVIDFMGRDYYFQAGTMNSGNS